MHLRNNSSYTQTSLSETPLFTIDYFEYASLYAHQIESRDASPYPDQTIIFKFVLVMLR